MPQIRHIANFSFPNWHQYFGPENTCEVIMAANEAMTTLDVLMTQRRDEWKQGTSAMNQVEVIAVKLVNEVFPDVYQEYPELRSATVNWYVQVDVGDTILSRIKRVEINFNWPPKWQRTWMWEKFVGRGEITFRDFKFQEAVEPDTLLVQLDD